MRRRNASAALMAKFIHVSSAQQPKVTSPLQCQDTVHPLPVCLTDAAEYFRYQFNTVSGKTRSLSCRYQICKTGMPNIFISKSPGILPPVHKSNGHIHFLPFIYRLPFTIHSKIVVSPTNWGVTKPPETDSATLGTLINVLYHLPAVHDLQFTAYKFRRCSKIAAPVLLYYDDILKELESNVKTFTGKLTNFYKSGTINMI